MKIKYKKIIKYLLILIFITIFIKIFFQKNYTQIVDDIIFLKLLSNPKNNINSNVNLISNNNTHKKQYEFKINYKNTDFKSIDLGNTVNKETLVYEKIAPGTNGSFSILLDSNQNLKYKVIFDSLNEKPKNLNFIALKDNTIIAQTDTLEELSNYLFGEIRKNEKIDITINWYWNFDNNSEQFDLQDTKDAENIKKYQFNISTFGEEII